MLQTRCDYDRFTAEMLSFKWKRMMSSHTSSQALWMRCIYPLALGTPMFFFLLCFFFGVQWSVFAGLHYWSRGDRWAILRNSIVAQCSRLLSDVSLRLQRFRKCVFFSFITNVISFKWVEYFSKISLNFYSLSAFNRKNNIFYIK